MIVKRLFGRINIAPENMTHRKYEDIPDNRELFFYEFKHIKTDKVDNFTLIGNESDELYESDKLFNFWSEKFFEKKIRKRDFKLTGWSLMTLVKRNNFFKTQSIVCSSTQKPNEESDVELFAFFKCCLLRKLFD